MGYECMRYHLLWSPVRLSKGLFSLWPGVDQRLYILHVFKTYKQWLEWITNSLQNRICFNAVYVNLGNVPTASSSHNNTHQIQSKALTRIQSLLNFHPKTVYQTINSNEGHMSSTVMHRRWCQRPARYLCTQASLFLPRASRVFFSQLDHHFRTTLEQSSQRKQKLRRRMSDFYGSFCP